MAPTPDPQGPTVNEGSLPMPSSSEESLPPRRQGPVG